MSKNAAKVGNIGTDHDGFPPTKITAGSPDVFIDGVPAARVGDPLEPHDKPNNPPHPRKIASGSSTVFVNGKPLAITGSAVDCGGVIIGAGTVIVGDIAPPVTTPLNIAGLFDEHFCIMDSGTGVPFNILRMV
ncbi:type VI secretion system PAAR protein [Aeromonas jandaei]|uniref:type VI secretion system PAAR protein n=1 Tax=Aeromonas jandaei TaxID=650 RepID=UPI003EC611B5